MSFDTVRELGLALPDVEEGTAYGSPALKVRGRMFACIPTNRAAEANSLAVCVSFEDRDYLLRSEPNTYYLKPHYVNYPCVLVRLGKIRSRELGELLEAAHDFVASKARRGRPAKRVSRRRSVK